MSNEEGEEDSKFAGMETLLYTLSNYISYTDTAEYCLKTVDTIGICLRPVFILAVSQHMHKITNL